jgi:hypothetical protein
MTTKAKAPKPPYSKDRKLQLCSRCNRYCSRRLSICPTCDKWTEAWNEALKQIGYKLPVFRLHEHLAGERHFIGSADGKHGFFLVWGQTMILDRQAYKEIAAEAKARGLQRPYMIYGRVCSYTGPGIDFMHIGG